MICRRVRPVNVLKVRNTEALCLLRDDTGEEYSEWIDVEKIDESETEVLNEKGAEDICMPVADNLQEWLQSPWQNE